MLTIEPKHILEAVEKYDDFHAVRGSENLETFIAAVESLFESVDVTDDALLMFLGEAQEKEPAGIDSDKRGFEVGAAFGLAVGLMARQLAEEEGAQSGGEEV